MKYQCLPCTMVQTDHPTLVILMVRAEIWEPWELFCIIWPQFWLVWLWAMMSDYQMSLQSILNFILKGEPKKIPIFLQYLLKKVLHKVRVQLKLNLENEK